MQDAKVAEKKDNILSPEKVNMFKNYDEVLQRILSATKIEIENLQHQRQGLIVTNSQLDDDLNRKRSQFEQYKRQEEQKLSDWKNKIKNEEITRLYKLEVAESNMTRRDEEIKKREELGIKILEKEKKLSNDRIEVEKLRSLASSMMDDANRKLADASSKLSSATIIESKSKELEKKVNLLNEEVHKKEVELKERDKEVNDNIKNLEEIRKVITPKIEGLKLLEQSLDSNKKELEKERFDIDAKISKESELFKKLEEKESKLESLNRQLCQREEEINRKVILNKINE